VGEVNGGEEIMVTFIPERFTLDAATLLAREDVVSVTSTMSYIPSMISKSKHLFPCLRIPKRLQHETRQSDTKAGQQPINQLLHERKQVVDDRLQAQQQC